MVKIILNLSKMSRADKLALINTVEAKTPQVPGFPSPNPKLAELLAARDNARAKAQARDDKEAELKSANTDLQTADDRLDAALANHARQAEEVAGGDPAKITLLGYSVAGAPQPVGPMPKPENLAATVGDNDGELDASWNRIYGAKSYEVQTSPDPIAENSWAHALTATKSSVTVSGLPGGKKRWLRVRAIGAQGPGPWSDPACCMVP
jgi:hypothetical protein